MQVKEQYITYGKLPPQNIEAEEIVLGTILSGTSVFIDDVAGEFKPEIFYKADHQIIASAILSLYKKNKPIDLVGALHEVRTLNSEIEVSTLAKLTGRAVIDIRAHYHFKIIQEQAMRRSIIFKSNEWGNKAYNYSEDIFELIEKAENEIADIGSSLVVIGTKTGTKVHEETIASLELKKSQNGITGVPSGLEELDHITSGFQDTDLIILAGRPGMGKTAAALTFARNALRKGFPVGFFSLEMSNGQLMQRLLSQESEINLTRIRQGGLSPNELALLNGFDFSNIYFDDTSALPISDFRHKVKKLKRDHDIKIVFVDYLQLMRGSRTFGDFKGNREGEISFISRNLKAVAKEAKIPVVALAQLSRAVEQRGGDKIPMLSDLRESGAIEQDADVIIFSYRPEYYGITSDKEGNSLLGKAMFLVEKHRNGNPGVANTIFEGQYARFKDIQLEYSPTFAEREMDF